MNYTTGTGQEILNIHPETDECHFYGCIIHNPTDPHQHWPTHWDEVGKRLVRIRPDGYVYNDNDVVSYELRRATQQIKENEMTTWLDDQQELADLRKQLAEALADKEAYRAGWTSRGQDLNELYDVIAEVTGGPAGAWGGDPITDLYDLDAQIEILEDELEATQDLLEISISECEYQAALADLATTFAELALGLNEPNL